MLSIAIPVSYNEVSAYEVHLHRLCHGRPCRLHDRPKSPYDLTAVCLTDEGKPVSKGMTYKGKTCGQSDMPIADGKPTPLVWR
ncbi:hypothetical protein HGG76_28190 [Ochrobactrum tritici]|uniref:Uncharacterized protein n=1 Tax=Brucella tritici TaxID=94626 RepID=A0A7X6FT44_9HYPH|nr:hypothetical protein [Brucella tritici]